MILNLLIIAAVLAHLTALAAAAVTWGLVASGEAHAAQRHVHQITCIPDMAPIYRILGVEPPE